MPSQALAESGRNSQLLSWVKELEDAARAHNTKAAPNYKRAYNSLQACPLTIGHPQELKQLKGFGDLLCKRLTDRLQEWCTANGMPMPKKKKLILPASTGSGDNDATESGPQRKPRKAKPYVPTPRSGAYALIMGLYEMEIAGDLTKDDLINKAQPHCDSNFRVPSDPSSYYTAWNSMKTLFQRDIVYQQGGRLNAKYFLTEEGYEVARRIERTQNPTLAAPAAPNRPEREATQTAVVDLSEDTGRDRFTPKRSETIRQRLQELDQELDQEMGLNRPLPMEVEVGGPPPNSSEFTNVVPDGEAVPDSSALPKFRPGRLQPGTFSVQLILDNREIRSKTDRDYMSQELAKKGVQPIVRSLDLGDAFWVAKCHDPNLLKRIGAEGDEVMLDYIVERKRLDDLIGSLKDGRFHEQKFRLKRSGVKNVIYVIEEMTLDSANLEKYEESIRSAIASTQMVNGYFLKRTQKMDDTIRYLARMTMLLKQKYESKPLCIIPTEVLTARNYLPLLEDLRKKHPSTSHYISYQAFASLASKSGMMTLRDQYLKFLMCTRGVTGEKAIEIQKRWKTPHDFVKAFEGCGPDEQGKKRKRDMVAGKMVHLYGRKKVAKTLSHKIAEVWGDA